MVPATARVSRGNVRAGLAFDWLWRNENLLAALAGRSAGMVTVLFKCPKCQVCCISSLTLMDDVFALASEIPLRRQCWSCGADSLVVQKSGTRPIPHDGGLDLSDGDFLRAAAACLLRATDAKHPALRKLFLSMEESWLRLGMECGREQRPVIIEAREARLWMHARPQQIA